MHYAFALSYKLTGFTISSNMAMISSNCFFVWLEKTQVKILPRKFETHACQNASMQGGAHENEGAFCH